MQRNNQTNDPFAWVGFGTGLPTTNTNNTAQYTKTKPAPKATKSKGPSMQQQMNAPNNNNPSNNSDPFNSYDPFGTETNTNNTSNDFAFNSNNGSFNPNTNANTANNNGDTFDNLWTDTNPVQPTQKQTPQQNTHSSTTNHDNFMDFDSLFNDNNTAAVPVPNANTTVTNATDTPATDDFDNLWSDEQSAQPSQPSQPSQPMDLNFLFSENSPKKTKKKKAKKPKKKLKYDPDIVQQLVSLNLGTKQECIKASLQCVNFKDINEVTEILRKSQNNQSYLKGYNQRNTLPSNGSMSGMSSGNMWVEYSKGDIKWAHTYSSADFDGGDMSKIYARIGEAHMNFKKQVYTKDIDPDNSDLLVDINNGELHFFVPRKKALPPKFRMASYKSESGGTDSSDSDSDDMKLDPTYDPFAPIPKDINKMIKLVKELEKKKESQTIDVRDYKKKKYDGIVSYLGFLIGLAMTGTSLKVKESHSFNVKKSAPFSELEKDWKRGKDSQKKRIFSDVSEVLLTEEIGGKSESKYGGMLQKWEKLNSLEKKVYLLKFFMFMGTDLVRVSDEDINIREMDSEDIDANNAMLNGGEEGFAGMMAGMMGDSDGEVECKQM